MTRLHPTCGGTRRKSAPARRDVLAKGKVGSAPDQPRGASGRRLAPHRWAADRGASGRPTGRAAIVRRGEGA
jgi:hypothetical protein